MSSGDDRWGVDGRTVIRPAPPRAASAEDRTVIVQRPARPPAASDRTLIAAPQAPRPTPAEPSSGAASPAVSYPSENALLAAAAPLLVTLGRAQRLREALAPEDAAAAIASFQQKASAAGVPAEQIHVATYALCETADDIARSLPGMDLGVWVQHGMVARFYRTQARGNVFFDSLNRLLADPEPHLDLIELMHACLALGFEGQYRGRPDSLEELRRIRADLHATLRHLRPAPAGEIAPRWREGGTRKSRRSHLIRTWGIVAGAPLVAAAVFLTLSYLIGRDADAAVERLLAHSPDTSVVLDRTAIAAPVETPEEPVGPSRLERMRAALAEDIRSGAVAMSTHGGSIVLTIDNALLFRPGGAELRAEFAPVARRIAAMLEPEPGAATVVGHTDNVQPGRGSAFPSNQELSVARARAVRDAIAAAMSDPERLAIEGRGDAEPIADNATPEGRAANRRVDIILPLREAQ